MKKKITTVILFIHRFVSQQVYSIYKDFSNIDYRPISVGQGQNHLMRLLSNVETDRTSWTSEMKIDDPLKDPSCIFSFSNELSSILTRPPHPQ